MNRTLMSASLLQCSYISAVNLPAPYTHMMTAMGCMRARVQL